MPELQEFRLTFGIRYAHEEHPLFPKAHPDGYVAVLAPTYEAARSLVITRVGHQWAFLYEPGGLKEQFCHRGEIARWSTLPPDTDLDLSNRQLVVEHRGFVITQQSSQQVTPQRALVHAAWLVRVASEIDPTLPPFGEVLSRVKHL